MSYRIVIMCKTKWVGTELEVGDLGESYNTEEEATKVLDSTELTEEDYQAGAEAQGLEVWLEVKP